jgi:hypothetical protein
MDDEDGWDGGKGAYFTYRQVREMDDNFAEAMRAAKRAGLESFHEGVVKDHTPFSPTHFAREMMARSFTGSSGAVCVDDVSAQRDARPAPTHLSR